MKKQKNLKKNMYVINLLEIQGDNIFSISDLIDMDLYYNRPASELIFLSRKEHTSLHSSNVKKETNDKRKKSLALFKENNPDFYKKSDDFKQKMSEIKLEYWKTHSSYLKGKHLSDETKTKLREANIGKKASEETKLKMRKSARKKLVIQYDLEMNEIARFESTKDVQRKLGYTPSKISKCCLGKQKSPYKGSYWKYQ